MNPETGQFQKLPSLESFLKMPFELKIETTRANQIKGQGAEQIITGRFVNKKRTFFSGLRRTEYSNWFHGNDFEYINGEKVNSLVIFQISPNAEFLNVFYFNRYYKYSPNEREQFVNRFIGGQLS